MSAPREAAAGGIYGKTSFRELTNGERKKRKEKREKRKEKRAQERKKEERESGMDREKEEKNPLLFQKK